MDEDTAKLIFLVVMATGVTVWAVSLSRALRMGRPSRRVPAGTIDDWAEASPFEWQTGTITLRGSRESLSKALLRSLLQQQFGMLASVFKIQQYEDERIVLKKFGPLVCNLPASLYFTEAESHSMTRAPAQSTSHTDWATVVCSAGSNRSRWLSFSEWGCR